MSPTIKCCIGNYGAYSAGYLLDEWFELPMAPGDLAAQLEEIRVQAENLTGSPCEEFYVSDYDGYPLDVAGNQVHDMFSELTPIEDLNLMAAQLSTMTDDEIEAASAYLGQQGSTVSMDEAMNVLLQADEVPYYSYEWGEYKGSDPVGQAVHDSTAPEEKYGYLCVEAYPELSKLLDENSLIESAFDYEEYGRLCADMDGACLLENGYLANESVDMNLFDHSEILEEVIDNLIVFGQDHELSQSFAKAQEKEIAREIFQDLTAGHSFYNEEEARVVGFVKEGADRKFAVIDGVDDATVREAFSAGKELGQYAFDKGLACRIVESHDDLNEMITAIGAGGSRTGWFMADREVLAKVRTELFPHPSQFSAVRETYGTEEVTTYTYKRNDGNVDMPLDVQITHASTTDDYSWQVTHYDQDATPGIYKAGVSATFKDAYTAAATQLADANYSIARVKNPDRPGTTVALGTLKDMGALKPPDLAQAQTTPAQHDVMAIQPPVVVR